MPSCGRSGPPWVTHTQLRSAVRSGLRELRPRGGRSPWRALYRQVGGQVRGRRRAISAGEPTRASGERAAWPYSGSHRSEEVEQIVKLSELRTADELAPEELRDPAVRQEYERTAFANGAWSMPVVTCAG